MNDFAVVSEGFTDQPVLNRILLTYFKTPEAEPAIVFEQPRVDATGERQWQEYGTWHNVFRYLEERLYRDAFQTSRYLVVQIDSDCSEAMGYGVSQNDAGRPLTTVELVDAIVQRFCAVIGEDDCAYYEGRFVFAVCVREIECWLLPLWLTEDKKAETTGCLDALNSALARQNQPTISRLDKDDRRYKNAVAGYKKRSVLLAEGSKNESLHIFLDRLATCSVQPENV